MKKVNLYTSGTDVADNHIEVRNSIESLLDQIPVVEKRVLFKAIYIYGVLPSEMAALLGVAPSTITRRLLRIIKEAAGQVVNNSKWQVRSDKPSAVVKVKPPKIRAAL